MGNNDGDQNCGGLYVAARIKIVVVVDCRCGGEYIFININNDDDDEQ